MHHSGHTIEELSKFTQHCLYSGYNPTSNFNICLWNGASLLILGNHLTTIMQGCHNPVRLCMPYEMPQPCDSLITRL